MRKVFAVILNFVSKFIAGIFAVLFVVVTVLVLMLTNVDRVLLNAQTYKRALVEQKIYERIPGLAAEQLGTLKTFISNPCAENPLSCRIDGASPELRACLTEGLGDEAIADIGSMKRQPTEAELQLAQPCLGQYGGQPTGENPLLTASPEVLACVKQAVGEEGYDTLLNGMRSPTDAETRKMSQCMEQTNENSNGPGLGGEQMAFMNNLTQEDWGLLISTLLPPDDLQRMIEDALDQIFTYFNGDADSARISLVTLKERLTSQAGRDVIKIILNAQPPCTEEQLAQMVAGVSGGQGKLVLCVPPEEKLDTQMSDMQKQLDALVAKIPDEAEIIKPTSTSVPTAGGGPLGKDPLTAFRHRHLGVRLSPLLLLGLLLLVAIFGVRSLKGLLRWWGFPMFIAGLIPFSIGIAAIPALDWAWEPYIAVKIPSLISSNLSDVGHDLMNSVVHELAKWIMLNAGAVILLGLAAIVGSFFVNRKRKKTVPLKELS